MTKINLNYTNNQLVTRNISKSCEVLNWGGFSPDGLHFGLIDIHSQFASCHITNGYGA